MVMVFAAAAGGGGGGGVFLSLLSDLICLIWSVCLALCVLFHFLSVSCGGCCVNLSLLNPPACRCMDVDDVAAVCMAHALADNGEADILAIVQNTRYTHYGPYTYPQRHGKGAQPTHSTFAEHLSFPHQNPTTMCLLLFNFRREPQLRKVASSTMC